MSLFRWRSVVLSAFLLADLFGSQIVYASTSGGIDYAQYEAGERNKYSVLERLVPALMHAEKAGRIYYTASCPPDEAYPYYVYPFPKIDVKPPSKGVTGLSAVREIFREDTNVTTEERPPGIIRVRIDKAFDTVLQTKISRITLKPDEQYDYILAINAIEDSEEIQAAMQNLGAKFDSRPMNILVRHPAEGLPHLPSSLPAMTIDDALDMVAQTFGGIVMYGTCTNQHYIWIEFTGGPDFVGSHILP